MKKSLSTLTIAAALAASSSLALAADNHGNGDKGHPVNKDHSHSQETPHDNHAHDAEHSHGAAHGGIFIEGKEADYELLATADHLQLYVTDHGKPRNLAQASAQLTVLSGGERQEVQLIPSNAGDKLHAEGAFKVVSGAKIVAVVSDGGKTLGTARFTVK